MAWRVRLVGSRRRGVLRTGPRDEPAWDAVQLPRVFHEMTLEVGLEVPQIWYTPDLLAEIWTRDDELLIWRRDLAEGIRLVGEPSDVLGERACSVLSEPLSPAAARAIGARRLRYRLAGLVDDDWGTSLTDLNRRLGIAPARPPMRSPTCLRDTTSAGQSTGSSTTSRQESASRSIRSCGWPHWARASSRMRLERDARARRAPDTKGHRDHAHRGRNPDGHCHPQRRLAPRRWKDDAVRPHTRALGVDEAPPEAVRLRGLPEGRRPGVGTGRPSQTRRQVGEHEC